MKILKYLLTLGIVIGAYQCLEADRRGAMQKQQLTVKQAMTQG